MRKSRVHYTKFEYADDNERLTRPFSFADLRGQAEPEDWGPTYPVSLGAAVEKWRKLDKKRELTVDENRQWGAAVHDAIRKLNNPALRRADVPLHCTVQNTCRRPDGKLLDCTAEGEARRYQAYVDRLNAERLARRAADPQWLDKRIVQAFEREFADLYAPAKPKAPTLPRKPSRTHKVRKAA